jgi:carbon storage regulator
MLVIGRKKNESIVINDDITITVLEIRDDKVRLGIVAPREATVHRKEVYDAIHGRSGGEPMPAAFDRRPAHSGDLLRELLAQGFRVRFTAEGGFLLENPAPEAFLSAVREPGCEMSPEEFAAYITKISAAPPTTNTELKKRRKKNKD